MTESGPHLERLGPDFKSDTTFERGLHVSAPQSLTEYVDENGETAPLSSVSFDHIKSLDEINMAIEELEQDELEAEQHGDTGRGAHITAQLLKAWRQQVRIMNNRV